jgi:hypothetical protein
MAELLRTQGTTRPSHVFELAPEVEQLLSKAIFRC